MNRPPKSKQLWPWVQFYLEVHLPQHKGFSPNTISSYRTAFRLLRDYFGKRDSLDCDKRLSLSVLTPALLLDFLDWLERGRGRPVSVATRNQRLAALRSFFAFLELYCDQIDSSLWRRLGKLPFKRARKERVDYLESKEMGHLLNMVPRNCADGSRDFLLLTLLYNTGARASEVALLQKSDLMLAEPASVRFVGKGDKVRVCPLWSDTARLLEGYLREYRRRPLPGNEPFVFINQRGGHLTRFGIGRVVAKYMRLAGQRHESLAGKRLSTHSIRHSTAIHLLQSGADLNVIRTWLGHASMSSTSHYLDLNLETQRDFLTKFTAPLVIAERASAPCVKSEPTDDDIVGWLTKL